MRLAFFVWLCMATLQWLFGAWHYIFLTESITCQLSCLRRESHPCGLKTSISRWFTLHHALGFFGVIVHCHTQMAVWNMTLHFAHWESYLPTGMPYAQVSCLWIENFDLTPAHASYMYAWLFWRDCAWSHSNGCLEHDIRFCSLRVYLPTLMPADWKLWSHDGSHLRAKFSNLIEQCEWLQLCLTQFLKVHVCKLKPM